MTPPCHGEFRAAPQFALHLGLLRRGGEGAGAGSGAGVGAGPETAGPTNPSVPLPLPYAERQGLMDCARHVIKRVVDPRLLSSQTEAYEVASTTHQSPPDPRRRHRQPRRPLPPPRTPLPPPPTPPPLRRRCPKPSGTGPTHPRRRRRRTRHRATPRRARVRQTIAQGLADIAHHVTGCR
jgi:hypothetical protein